MEEQAQKPPKRVQFRNTVFVRGDDEQERRPLTLLVPELFEAETQRDKRKVIVDGVDRTPESLAERREFFYQDSSNKPASSIWDRGFELNKLPGILNLDLERVRENAKVFTMEDIAAVSAAPVEGEEVEGDEPTIPGLHLIRKNSEIRAEPDYDAVYIKILITETDDIALYESPSLTVMKEEQEKPPEKTPEVKPQDSVTEVLKKFSDAEAQTSTILHKSKAVNTDRIKKVEQSSFVSNYDMWDTYAELEAERKDVEVGNEHLEITTFSKEGMKTVDEILAEHSQGFRKSSMVIERLLAANIFGEAQKRFRNFQLPDPCDRNLKYLYRLKTLWTYKNPDLLGKAVASFSWCPRNGDILAVAYGVYGFATHEHRNVGYVCLWNIKNPVNPERLWKYKVSVTAVAFCKSSPQLLAIGLYNGRIEIRDVTREEDPPVAKSDSKNTREFEPIMQIEWIEVPNAKEALLAASLDGTVMRYTIVTGNQLLGLQQILLDRVEGVVEGLKIAKKKPFLEANRHPQALCLRVHPVEKKLYFIGTDEGCLHKCSIFYPHHHIGVLQAHQGGIYAIEYSPFSSKVFLTCGADWKVRIWAEGIFEPLIELEHSMKPYQAAVWSPIHSTIFATCTRSSVQIWDLRRKNTKPAARHQFDSSTTLTTIKFSSCGRSLIVGDAEGKVMVCACEDMPFPPHFQYEELESALLKILDRNETVLKQFKGIVQKPD